MKNLNLDVGCGDNPHGDVNVDYRTYQNIELDQVHTKYVDIKNIPNFIRADALHLPFPNKSFVKTYCYHVIEHVSNPFKLIEELIRVTTQTLEIRCPHRFSKHAKMPYHRHYFTRSWFDRVFIGYKVRVKVTYWSPLREMFGFIRLPHEIRIRVELHKVTAKK